MRPMYRLLLDADAPGNAGGAVTPPTPAAPTPPPAPEPKPGQGTEPGPVTLNAADHQKLLAAVAELSRRDTEAAAKAEAARLAEEKRLEERGEWKKLHEAQTARLNEAEAKREVADARVRRTLLDKELTAALATFDLVPGGMGQLSELFGKRLEVVEDGEAYAVRTKATGLQVAEWLAIEMTRPENEHWLKATGRGGVGASGGDKKAAAPAEAPKSLGELWAAEWKAKRAQGPSFGLGGKIGGR